MSSAQHSLNFDIQGARDDKRKAIDRVESHANKEWLEQMFEVVCQVARTNQEFTADLPMEIYYKNPDRPQTHNLKAMAGVMRRARREGIAVPTDRYINSNRRSCHNRPLRVWKSLVFSSHN